LILAARKRQKTGDHEFNRGMNFDDVSSPNRFPVLLPILFLYPRAIQRLHKERAMHPMLVIAVPLVLIIVGMVLNSIGLSFDQPPALHSKIRLSN
jgi:hypothetical protein